MKSKVSDLIDLRTLIGETITIYSESPEQISHPDDIVAVLWYHGNYYLRSHTALSYADKNTVSGDKYIALLSGDGIWYQGYSKIYIAKSKDSHKELLKGDKNAKLWINTYIKPGKPE